MQLFDNGLELANLFFTTPLFRIDFHQTIREQVVSIFSFLLAGTFGSLETENYGTNNPLLIAIHYGCDSIRCFFYGVLEYSTILCLKVEQMWAFWMRPAINRFILSFYTLPIFNKQARTVLRCFVFSVYAFIAVITTCAIVYFGWVFFQSVYIAARGGLSYRLTTARTVEADLIAMAMHVAFDLSSIVLWEGLRTVTMLEQVGLH